MSNDTPPMGEYEGLAFVLACYFAVMGIVMLFIYVMAKVG